MTTQERFWNKILKTNNCWFWIGSRLNSGYGQFRNKIQMTLAHRYSWEIHNGPIPKGNDYHGICVLHKCDNRACVNPDHLFLGTQNQNMKDMVKKKRSYDQNGQNNHRAKLTKSQVEEIRKLYKQGVAQSKLVLKFKMSSSVISNIVNRRSWRNI